MSVAYSDFEVITPRVDLAVATEFVEQLYRDVVRGWLALNHDTGQFDVEWFGLDDLAAIARRAVEVRPRTGVWVSVATRAKQLGTRRGGVADCLDVVAAVVDIDVAGPGHSAADLPPTMADAFTLLDDVPLPPTAIVTTGHGLQAWWVFAEPVAAVDAEPVLRRWAATWRVLGGRRGWRVDNVGSVEHVFRLPGTLNTKAPDDPKRVRIFEAAWDRRYSLDDLDERTIDEETPPRPPRPVGNGIPLGGEQRPGDWYNATHDVDSLLIGDGCVYSSTSRNGERHYFAQHRAATRETTGVTVYADPDGDHAVIWSATYAAKLRVEDRASVDAFGLFARIVHGGDFDAAARAASAERDRVSSSTSAGDPPDPSRQSDRTHLPEMFWTARPILGHIRQAAHSRGASADAVLAVILARVAAITDPSVALPAIIGTRSPLNTYVALLGRSGSGKSVAKQVACELLPYDGDDVADDFPLGSGEGLIEVFFDLVSEKDPETNTKRNVKKQARHGAFMFLDEGQALAELGGRKGATLAPTLRSAWSGQTLGSANATNERNRRLTVGSYVLGFVVCYQPERAGELLADAVGGTPQRFLWVRVEDPSKPRKRPEWPGVLPWTPLPLSGYGNCTFDSTLAVAAEVVQQISDENFDVGSGAVILDPLDEHLNLARLKVAGILALLDGRRNVTVDDWALAGMVSATSCAVRTTIVNLVAADHRKTEQAHTAKYVARERAVVDDQLDKALERMVRAIARHVHRQRCDGPCRRTCVSRACNGDDKAKASVDAAIQGAIELGWVDVEGDTFIPGKAQPA
jgi:hypothetical protein